MENNPSNPVPGAEQNVPAAESKENVTPSLREVINQATGRSYATDEDALKGVGETFKMVGKKVEPQIVEKQVVPQEVLTQVQALQQDLKVRDFYEANPDLKEFKDVLAKFGDPSDAVKDPTVKLVIDALKGEKSKSVLNSNRIQAQPSEDYQTALKRAKDTGNWSEFLEKYKGVQTPA